MSNVGTFDSIKSFDMYKRLPKDLVQPTFSGALISLLSTGFLIYLLVNEVKSFQEVKKSSEVIVETNKGGDKIKLNIDILLKNIPCSILSIDVEDIMGTHNINVNEPSLQKIRYGSSNNVIGPYIPPVQPELSDEEEDENEKLNRTINYTERFLNSTYDNIKKNIKDKEGCKVVGDIFVKKVPGNIHFSTHGYRSIVGNLASEGYFTYDFSHIINSFSIGDSNEANEIRRKFGDDYDLSRLNSAVKLDMEKKVFEYYLNIVPSTFIDLSNKVNYIYQYTYQSYEALINKKTSPALYFRYDVTPLSVTTTLYKESLIDFLIKLCAIIGGIFTVTGIIDAITYETVATLLQKAHMGKIS